MADVRPLNALHYDLAASGPLDDVLAPPYDVIDAEQRAELLARSPFNASRSTCPSRPPAPTPTSTPAEIMEQWLIEGILTADREPAIWALTQDYPGPDGSAEPAAACSPGCARSYAAGVMRPHERTQPGPKEDRLRLTRATRHNLSPIFSLHPGDAWRRIEPALDARALGRGHRRRRHGQPGLANRRPAPSTRR